MTGRRCVTPLGQQPAPPPLKATGERSRVNYLKTDSTRSTTLRCAPRHGPPGQRTGSNTHQAVGHGAL